MKNFNNLKIKEFLELKYPIIQAPMAGGIVSSDFIATVANFGMLGSIPSGYLTSEALDKLVKEVKEKTKNPVQVNIFINYDNYQTRTIRKTNSIISIEKQLGIYKEDTVKIESELHPSEAIEIAIKNQIPAVSSVFGKFSDEDITKLKSNNIKIISTINNIEELHEVSQFSDAIVYQNNKAGGHKGGFIGDSYSSNDEIIALKVKYPNIVFIKSGAILTKSDITHSLSEGFDMVQIGTGFLMTQESSANNLYKNMLLSIHKVDDIIFTKSITGKSARGYKNKIASLEYENIGFPDLHYMTKDLRAYSKQNEIKDYQSFWTGDGSVKIEKIATLDEYMKSIVN